MFIYVGRWGDELNILPLSVMSISQWEIDGV